MYNLYIPLCGLIINIILIIMYSWKVSKIREENKFYLYMLVDTMIMTIFCMLAVYLIYIKYDQSIIKITNKIECAAICNYFMNLLMYILHMCNMKSKNLNKTYIITNIIIFALVFIAPVSLEVTSDLTYMVTVGPSVTITTLFSGIFLVSTFILAIKNHNKLQEKVLPILILLVFIIAVLLIRGIVPEFICLEFLATTALMIMYFTLENPDIKMLEEVSIAKESAEKANNAKSDFLSNMSHEIRTPLNAIVGFSESLKEDNLSEDSRNKVNDIITASNNLLEIVNGILDISKIEANKLEIINKEYDVHSMLDELVSLTKARIGSRDLLLNVNIDKALPSVLYGDNTRLKQIILNLLTNAVKYTKEGSINFTVSTVIKDNICRLIISVEDTGIGMKEESLNKLFTKFERLNVEKQITIEGTGLGLAITKKLVDLMNGKIIVQSVYGKGSKFTVSIDQRIIAVEKPITKQEAKSESKIVDANGAKVLLVDDNELNIKVAATLLKKYNFTIDSCTSAIACIAKIKNGEEFDLILMDDMMPKMTGKEAVKQLKSDPNYKIPTIVLTANAITGMREEYLAAGFDDYLSKPIEKKELERVIKEHINYNNNKSMNTSLSKATNSIIENKIDLDKTIILKPIESTKTYTGTKVLLVDDNELNIKVAETTLKKYELDITSVTSGSECIEKVIENEYDIILLDDMMPELDGCQTLENLKSLDGFKTPVIMMTASSKDEVQNKLDTYGFDGYLSKPFNKKDLEEIFETLLNK